MRLALPPDFGVIPKGCILTIPAFQERLNVGEAWLRTARREGLRIAYAGKKGFIDGDDFAEFLRRRLERGGVDVSR